MIDFSRAFDRVDHPTLLLTSDNLSPPLNAMNWIILFLTHRTQVVKVIYQLSLPQPIETSIVQAQCSMLLRKVIYEPPHRDANCAADDTNMLVPQNCDTCITLEYKHVKKCTTNNKMVIKQEKTKEVIFRRSHH